MAVPRLRDDVVDVDGSAAAGLVVESEIVEGEEYKSFLKDTEGQIKGLMGKKTVCAFCEWRNSS